MHVSSPVTSARIGLSQEPQCLNVTKSSLHVTDNRGSVILWGRCDTLCTSGSDVMPARNDKEQAMMQKGTFSKWLTRGTAADRDGVWCLWLLSPIVLKGSTFPPFFLFPLFFFPPCSILSHQPLISHCPNSSTLLSPFHPLFFHSSSFYPIYPDPWNPARRPLEPCHQMIHHDPYRQKCNLAKCNC